MPPVNPPIEEKSFAPTDEVSMLLSGLESHGSIQIRLSGNCMWPVVRHGDRVTITKAEESNLGFGDVAVRKISGERFHANTCFLPFFKARAGACPLLGKITQAERNGKIFDLEKRPFLLRLWQVLLSPANPWFLGAPSRILRLFRSNAGRYCGMS